MKGFAMAEFAAFIFAQQRVHSDHFAAVTRAQTAAVARPAAPDNTV